MISIAIMTIMASAAFLIPSVHPGPYRYYDVLMSDFKTLADSHPNLVTFEVIGKTVQGRDIIMVRIGTPSCDSILLDGAIHGWETLGSELLCFFAKWLLTSGDQLAGQMLAESYILIIPGVNVDGFNIRRTNVNGVDLNRNFATNWDRGGSSDPNSENYRGTAPLSEPESQALVRTFEKYRPRFYLNLHFGPGGAQYYFGSSYGNRTYYSIITNRIRSLCQQRGVVPYPYSGEAGSPGFAISDAARAGITSFLVELMDQIIPLSDIESVVLPRFLPMMEVLSQECASGLLWPTDLNGDGKVNILDVTVVAAAFDTRPGDARWNATADLDKNEWVNIIDLSKVAIDNGKTV
jgi:predicted deacylase